MSEKTLGQVAFEEYSRSKGGLTYDGKPIPPWDSLTDGIAVRAAWEKAADATGFALLELHAHDPAWHLHHARQCIEKMAPSREASLVLTKIDEAALWCTRAM